MYLNKCKLNIATAIAATLLQLTKPSEVENEWIEILIYILNTPPEQSTIKYSEIKTMR